MKIKNKSNLYTYRDLKIINDRFEINKLMYKYTKVIKELLEYHDKLFNDNTMEIYNDILNNGYYDRKKLNIAAEEIIAITKKKELTSYYIDMISYQIMKGDLENKKEDIIKYLKREI